MRILIAYATTHGHTGKIAERIAERMRRGGAEVVTENLRLLSPGLAPSAFDAILVGGRVHGGSYHWRIIHFVRRHLNALRSRPSGFFSVSLLHLAKDAARRAETAATPERTLARLGWKPDRIEVIAGALLWTRYGRLGRLIMKLIWKNVVGELDTTRDQVFTDWAQVDQFADGFLRLAELGRREPPPAPQPGGPTPSATR